jgi:coproporphyrinogen III oxidase-like Fe-S oxidoreductase
MDLILSEYPSSALTIDFLLAVPMENKEQDLQLKQSFLETYDPGHVSAYILTLEKNTLLYSQVNHLSKVSMPTETQTADSYIQFQQMMRSLNYCQYEISNYHKVNLGTLINLYNNQISNQSITKCIGQGIKNIWRLVWVQLVC